MNIIPNSEVRFIKNVPFSNNYRNVRLFNNQAEQEAYFTSLSNLSVDTFKYIRNNGTIKVPFYRDEILQYNYMMFKNKAFGNKWFYAFITNVNYLNPNTSIVNFEIDVFQTWYLDVNWQPSYVEREHQTRWNSDGSPVINTIPEGLDYGSDYLIKSVSDISSLTIKGQVSWIILCVALDQLDFATPNAYTNNAFNGGLIDLMQYIAIPFIPTEISSRPVSVISTNDTSAMSRSQVVLRFIVEIWRNSTLLSGKLKSMYVTDFLPISYNVDNSGEALEVTSPNLALYEVYTDVDRTRKTTFPFVIFDKTNPSYQSTIVSFPNKYQALSNGITESKLLMFPYSFCELNDMQGNSFVIKNEYIDGNSIRIKVRGSLGSTNKVAYTLQNYLNSSVASDYCYLDNGIINTDSKRLTTIDEYTSAYIQGHMNQLSNTEAQAQQTANLNNQLALNNANSRTAVNDVQNRSRENQALLSFLGSAIGSGASIITTDGKSVGGALSGTIQSASNLINSQLQTIANDKVNSIQNENSIANTKLQGTLHVEQTIASNLAKMQDVRNMADNVSLQSGDANFTYGYNNGGCKLIKKQITPEYLNILQDYFQKFGYACHKVKLPNIKTRQNWNYIQTTGASLTGNIPEMYITALEGLFDNGVTIWHTDNVGNYNLSNNEI